MDFDNLCDGCEQPIYNDGSWYESEDGFFCDEHCFKTFKDLKKAAAVSPASYFEKGGEWKR